MDMSDMAHVLNGMVALIISLSFHEFAHAFAAKVQGDSTAKDEGRLTINPIPHMDPIGTLFFPLLGSLTGAAIIGWAKPVPVNTANLKNPKWGYVLVAAAGPAANLVLCLLCVLFFRAYDLYLSALIAPGDFSYGVIELLRPMITINAILAIFNLIPLPPLDGGTVFAAFLPQGLRESYESYVAPYGMFILLALFFTNSLSWMGQLAMGYITMADRLVMAIL